MVGVLINEEGIFTFLSFKKGAYLLEANYLGYETYWQRVMVGELSAFLDLGTLSMIEQPRSLDQVVASSEAQEVSGQVDKKNVYRCRQYSSKRHSSKRRLRLAGDVGVAWCSRFAGRKGTITRQ